MISDDEMLFLDESGEDDEGLAVEQREPWGVMVVDDDREIHAITRMLLDDLRFKERPVSLISAYSAAEAEAILRDGADIAVILLDVVMETDDAGLRLVRTIREDLGNRHTRIILRTGQPGQAPEREVIDDYDINDYKAKTELTAQKLYTTMISALRSYDDIMALVSSRQGLEKILAACATLYQQRSMEMFAAGVLTQLNALIGVARDGVLCLQQLSSGGDLPRDTLSVIAASGRFESLVGQRVADLPDRDLASIVLRACTEETTVQQIDGTALFMRTADGRATVIYLHTGQPLTGDDQLLVQAFCDNISAGFDTVAEVEALRAENAALKAKLAGG